MKDFLDRCLVFAKSKTATYDIAGFVDSGYDGDLDRRHSISSYIFTLCVGAISWKASLQSIVALSTIAVEYIVAIEGIKEATWLRGLITELGISQGVTIVFCIVRVLFISPRMMLITPRPSISASSTNILEIL